jgi:hypothetical protein
MAWTTPKTWNTGDLVTATDLNTHLRDNLDALKGPPTGSYVLNQGSDYTTTSTSFVDLDATNLSLTITTTGGDVLVVFAGTGLTAGGNAVYLDITLDGTRVGGNDGIVDIYNGYFPIPLVYLLRSVSAGSHTIKLQWKVSGGTGTLFAGAGTSAFDLHPQFWVREVS